MARQILLALVAVLTAAAPAASQAPSGPQLSVKEVMRHIVNPAAERFWKGSGSVSTEDGVEERTPTSDAAWAEMVDAAAQVQEAGNLLMSPGRGPDEEAWRRYARQLSDAGAAAAAAARAKDADKVFETGGEIYNACFACHGRYIPRPANSLWKQP
jgi:cytochrome c556